MLPVTLSNGIDVRLRESHVGKIRTVTAEYASEIAALGEPQTREEWDGNKAWIGTQPFPLYETMILNGEVTLESTPQLLFPPRSLGFSGIAAYAQQSSLLSATELTMLSQVQRHFEDEFLIQMARGMEYATPLPSPHYLTEMGKAIGTLLPLHMLRVAVFSNVIEQLEAMLVSKELVY